MTTPLDLRVMGLLLEQGRRADALSRGLLLLVGLWLVLVATDVAGRVPAVAITCSLFVSVLAGLLQIWFALRVAFDSRLLLALADESDADISASRLDASLLALGLIRDDAQDRDWPTRWRGARCLLHRQLLCVGVQTAGFVLACTLAWWHHA